MQRRLYLPLMLWICFFAILVSGCSPQAVSDPTPTPAPTTSARLDQIRAEGKLVIGTAITEPFEFYDESGRLVGFDIDLANAIAARLGVTTEWHEVAFADLLTSLNEGQFDMVIASMYIRPDREALVDMSQPYLESGLVLLVQADETAVSDFADLAQRTLGVKENSTGMRHAEQLLEEGIPLEMRVYTDTLDSLDDLNAGLIDAAFNDRLNSLFYIQDHPGVRIEGEIFEAASLGIAVKSGDTDLLNFINESLAALERAGETGLMFEQWISGRQGS